MKILYATICKILLSPLKKCIKNVHDHSHMKTYEIQVQPEIKNNRSQFHNHLFLKYPILVRVWSNGHSSRLPPAGPSDHPRPQGHLEEQVLWSNGSGILHPRLHTPRSVVFPLAWMLAATGWHRQPRSSEKHGVLSPALSSGRARKRQSFPHYPQTCVNITTARNVTRKITSHCFPFSDIFCLAEFA